jgi:hypothetical protein
MEMTVPMSLMLQSLWLTRPVFPFPLTELSCSAITRKMQSTESGNYDEDEIYWPHMWMRKSGIKRFNVPCLLLTCLLNGVAFRRRTDKLAVGLVRVEESCLFGSNACGVKMWKRCKIHRLKENILGSGLPDVLHTSVFV